MSQSKRKFYPHLRALGGTALLFACTLMTGCVTATIQEVRQGSTSLGTGESIVVLGRTTRPTAQQTEGDFVSCINSDLSKASSGIGVIDERAFRDATFPWFEPRTAPSKTSDLPELIRQPDLSDRLREIGVKYVVWIEGSTERTSSAGSMTCTVSPGGAGCFGFLTWENDSNYEASIWDIRTGKTVGKISSEAVGTSFVPAVVVPLPFIARVRASACGNLSDQLADFIRGAPT